MTAPVDPKISQIGLGCSGLGNEFGVVDQAQATAVVRGALDLGVTYFDTSPYYGRTLSETRLGIALDGRRDEVFLATKAGRNDTEPPAGFDFSYEGIRSSCEASLRRLKTDHVDLLQLHDVEFGDRSQIEIEAIPALLDLVEAGKTRFVGVTGYPLPLLANLIDSHDFDFVLSYCHYTLINRQLQTQLLPVAERNGTAVINASVLHMGLLTRSGPPDWHPAGDEMRQAAAEAARLCDRRGVDIADLALRFALAADFVATTLIGTTNVDHLQHAIEAASQPVDEELLAAVTEVLEPVLDTTWESGIQQ